MSNSTNEVKTSTTTTMVNGVELNNKLIEMLECINTKSLKIRLLDKLDFTRGQISKILDIRYQHVRNVLITPIKNDDSIELLNKYNQK